MVPTVQISRFVYGIPPPPPKEISADVIWGKNMERWKRKGVNVKEKGENTEEKGEIEVKSKINAKETKIKPKRMCEE
jgi:hypothetical protein